MTERQQNLLMPVARGDAKTSYLVDGGPHLWEFFNGAPVAACRTVAGVTHFRDLVCWQLANELKLALYRLADSTAVRRDLRFREQLRHAAASGPRNIAEGFGRRTHREFAHLLDVARGSLTECQNHLHDAVDRGYLAPADSHSLISLAQRACGAVAALQRYLRRHPEP